MVIPSTRFHTLALEGFFLTNILLTNEVNTMNKLINFLKTTVYVIATVISVCLVAMTMLTALAAQASEPTAREQARIQWIAENGQYQPNLTEPAKQEALVFTATKQKELDNEKKGKSRN